MNTYRVSDGNGESEVKAETAREAAKTWVADGDWGAANITHWIDVWVTQLDADGQDTDEGRKITVEIAPEEPSCADGGDAHDWQSPYSLLGGLKENPGVSGNGGGVIITEVCRCCGCYRVTDTWDQRPDTGEQGLTSVEYREADEESIAWLDERQEEWQEWVRQNTDASELPDKKLTRAFIAIFRRLPDADDREQGLWSHLCAACPAEEESQD